MPQHASQSPEESTIPPLPRQYGEPDQPIYLNQESGVEVVKQMIADSIAENDFDSLFLMVNQLESLLNQHRHQLQEQVPQILAAQQQNLAKAKWLLLRRMTPNDIEDLFRNHFEHFFEQPWQEVLEQVRFVLLIEPSPSERDRIKERWRDAIAQSEVKIGQTPMMIGGKLGEPTVQNFLRDWRAFLGDKKPSPLLIVEYLNSSENIKQVSKETREQVEHLLKFLLELSKSSLTPEGAEEKVMVSDPVTGTYRLFSRGEMIDTGTPLPKEELEVLRYAHNVDEHGKPLSFTEQVKTSPLFRTHPPIGPIAKTPAPPPKQPKTPATIPVPIPRVPPLTPKPKGKRPTEKPIEHPFEVAQAVLSHHQLFFPSLDLEKRFLSIIVSYLSGARDRMEAQEALCRVPQEGGVNLKAAQASRILESTDQIVDEVRQHPYRPLTQPPPPPPQGPKPTLEEATKRIQRIPKDSPPQQQRGAGVEDILASIGTSPRHVTPPSPSPPLVPRHKKPLMTDIRKPSEPSRPTVMGPIDELRQMTKEEFRRLAEIPEQAAAKIVEKIRLLEEESIEQKAAGIAAWKTSPVNQLYVRIGNQSLTQTTPVGEVIKQMQEKGEETLSLIEFQAITDLNQKLRY